MAKRISTDAKIVLRNAGYIVEEIGTNRRGERSFLKVDFGAFSEEIAIIGGCVDNTEVERLLDLVNRWVKHPVN